VDGRGKPTGLRFSKAGCDVGVSYYRRYRVAELDPATHVFFQPWPRDGKTWTAGTSPAMGRFEVDARPEIAEIRAFCAEPDSRGSKPGHDVKQ
jgi:hypothetical protein